MMLSRKHTLQSSIKYAYLTLSSGHSLSCHSLLTQIIIYQVLLSDFGLQIYFSCFKPEDQVKKDANGIRRGPRYSLFGYLISPSQQLGAVVPFDDKVPTMFLESTDFAPSSTIERKFNVAMNRLELKPFVHYLQVRPSITTNSLSEQLPTLSRVDLIKKAKSRLVRWQPATIADDHIALQMSSWPKIVVLQQFVSRWIVSMVPLHDLTNLAGHKFPFNQHA